MPSDSALDRVARLLDLIPYLTSREVATSELAIEMEMSINQLERDLEVAFVCGLPGYTPDLLIDLTMDDGVISVSEPQVLDRPRRLTDAEVAALLLGLDLIEAHYGESAAITDAVIRLKSKLGTQETLKDAIASFDHGHSRKMAILESAIIKEQPVTFSYVDSLGRFSDRRVISPWEFRSRGGRRLLRGHDHDRKEEREFFISAMDKLDPVSDASAFITPNAEKKSSVSQKATVSFRFLPRWWLRRFSAFIEDLHEEGGESMKGSAVTIRFWDVQWLVRALIPVLDYVTDVEASGWSKDQIRHALLSHFSASEGAFD